MMTPLDLIRHALRDRHKDDLFGEEACCGSVNSPGATLRLDAWAARRSWAPWETIGYEIKVDRGDWLRDTKVERYTEYVHRLWIVCPWRMIAPEEVYPSVGLLWVNNTGSRLIRKKPAPRNDAPHWDKPLLSLLINRGSLDREERPSQVRALEEWVATKDRKRALGTAVAHQLYEMEREASRNEQARSDLDELRAAAKAAGWRDPWQAVARPREETPGLCRADIEVAGANIRAAVGDALSDLFRRL